MLKDKEVWQVLWGRAGKEEEEEETLISTKSNFTLIATLDSPGGFLETLGRMYIQEQDIDSLTDSKLFTRKTEYAGYTGETRQTGQTGQKNKNTKVQKDRRIKRQKGKKEEEKNGERAKGKN